MTNQVFRLRSTLALPLEDVHRFFDTAALPAAIADVEFTRRNNTLIIESVPAADTIGKYTATAQLKASVTEKRVYETGDGEWSASPPETHDGGARSERVGGPQAAENEEPASKLVEYASFQGDRETVLRNTELQYPMCEVLCDLARHAENGSLVAITAVDDHLKATRITDGEDRPATIEIADEPDQSDNEDDADWQDNPLIDGDWR